MAHLGSSTYVVGIDIGTTYSGYAYSSKQDFQNDQPKIFPSIWYGYTLMSLKCPTAILLDENKEFMAFGYEAENIFSEKLAEGEHEDFYYFHQFKMSLHNQSVTRNMKIQEVSGKSMEALTVFSITVAQLKDRLTKHIEGRLKHKLTNDDLYYVLTVPAIWGDQAKQFMYEAAENAGIKRQKLVIALESEAASIFCQTLKTYRELGTDKFYQRVTDEEPYMVINLGGGIVDISVHQRKKDGTVREVLPPCGGPWGSISIDSSFKSFLCDICGQDVIKCFQEESLLEYNAIFEIFEMEKRCIRDDYKHNQKRINLRIPITLIDLVNEKHGSFAKAIKNSNLKNKVIQRPDFLHISADVFRGLFTNTIAKIVDLVNDVLKQPELVNTDAVYMVGGFAKCKLVQSALKMAIGATRRLLIPEEEAELAVLKGAVLLGHQNLHVQSAESAYSDNPPFRMIENLSEFKSLVKKGMYKSYENKVYLAGPSQAGKTSLSSIFLGRPIPQTWKSTNGLTIYFGKNGIELKTKKMIPLRKEQRVQGKSGIIKTLLQGNPDVQHEVKDEVLENEDKKPVDTNPKPVAQVNSKITKVTITKKPTKSNIKPNLKRTMTNKKPLEHTKETKPEKETTPSPTGALGPSSTSTSLHDEILSTIRSGKYEMTVAPSDLVDFGGQRSFDMTHQLFIQYKGSFILLFDGSKGFDTQTEAIQDLEITAKSTFIHWVDSILVYCGNCDDNMPMILFAATHKDKISENELENKRQEYIEELTKVFSCHKFHTHIMYERLFFINACDPNDPEIEQLQDVLVDIAGKQSTWGTEMPVAWVPIEMSITEMRERGSKIVRISDIKSLNASNEDLALTNSQLDHFLRAYHTRGKILYFDLPVLKDFVVVEPSAMVNILRAFVTDEHFWPDNAKLRAIFETLRRKGVISKSHLFLLWSQSPFDDIVPSTDHKVFVLKLLIHLDILVEPNTYRSTEINADVFLVPCMVRKQAPESVLQAQELRQKAICLTYSLKEATVPSALAFKVIGAVTSIWPLKENDNNICLYFQAATLAIDDKNYFHISVKGKTITVHLVNETSKRFISPDIAASIQEYLTMALTQILIFYQRSFGKFEKQLNVAKMFDIKIGEPCKDYNICYLIEGPSIKDFWTCEENVKHDTVYPKYWLFTKSLKMCDRECNGPDSKMLSLIPDEQHLVRLCKLIGIRTFRLFIVDLGISTDEWEDIEESYRGNDMTSTKMIALCLWKRQSNRCSLRSLSQALDAVEIDQHLLCQVLREDRTFLANDQSGLQQIPSDEVLRRLSRNIGNCVVQLGIELGLTFVDVEETMYRYPKDMYQQTYSILIKWRDESKNKTVRRLMSALNNTKCGGLQFLADTYNVSL